MYAPKEQRMAGLACVLRRVPTRVFILACYRLMAAGYKRSQVYKQMDLARRSIGMTWKDWTNKKEA